ncbi:MAG TPA: acylneuraminate cytidylyltransferase [Vicinamibacterales bacterium]|nr:acylneuraminate cytidylyltransferase [Vicinamibacterales bacterium]
MTGTVAVVPALSGSESISRKHIRPLGAVPLLAYSIEAGLRARLVDRVIVSTDDEEIAEVARTWGADVPFLRSPGMVGDDPPVLQHVVGWLEANSGRIPEFVVQLCPTSPLRPPDCVDDAIEILRCDDTIDSVRGVVEVSQNPCNMWRLRTDGTMTPLIAEAADADNPPAQEPRTFRHTGHVDAVRTHVIRERESISGERIRALVLDAAYATDISTEADWQRAEWLLGHIERPVVRPGALPPFPEDPRLVVFDFDGVMTDNRVWIDKDGDERVACNRSDGLGLERLRRLGIDLFVLSTEASPVVGARCRKLGLPFEQDVRDKAHRLRTLLRERNLVPSRVVYVGNDVNDADCMELVGCGVAVADAHPDVLRIADVTLTRAGGHGAVRELCDLLEAHVCSRRRS